MVGLPGEEVQGLDDRLVVDGEVIDDPWHGSTRTPAFGPIVVPDGMVFVLGDNRSLSVDSRIFGAVPIEALTGRVDVVVWPPDRAGRVEASPDLRRDGQWSRSSKSRRERRGAHALLK